MLVTVAVTTWPWEAHLLRSRLEAEGIPTFVADDQLISNAFAFSLLLGGVKVKVPSELREEAAAIVADCEAGAYAEELQPEFGTVEAPHCPACSSTRFVSEASPGSLAVLLLSYFCGGISYSPARHVHRCGDCGHVWHDESGTG